MKLSTVWTDFDEFVFICETKGKQTTKNKIKLIKNQFNENDNYDGLWETLHSTILNIFCDDNKVAFVFDYESKEFIQKSQVIIKSVNYTSQAIRKELFNCLKNQSRNNQFWYTLNKSYKIFNK